MIFIPSSGDEDARLMTKPEARFHFMIHHDVWSEATENHDSMACQTRDDKTSQRLCLK